MPTTLTLQVDATSEARSVSLVSAVQAAYNSGGYPPLVITQAYVLTHAVHTGLRYWIPPRYTPPATFYPHGVPSNYPTLAKLTPAVSGSSSHSIIVPDADVAYADAIIAEIGGTRTNVLGCALCTGLAMLAGSPLQVGPWLP